jgi:hypothetical protein
MDAAPQPISTAEEAKACELAMLRHYRHGAAIGVIPDVWSGFAATLPRLVGFGTDVCGKSTEAMAGEIDAVLDAIEDCVVGTPVSKQLHFKMRRGDESADLHLEHLASSQWRINATILLPNSDVDRDSMPSDPTI